MGILFYSSYAAVFASPVYYDQNSSGASSETINPVFAPKIDGNTGALKYQYKFNVPEGRNGMTPSLQLNYSSQNSNNQNYAGYGFDLSIPFIQRLNASGTENLYTRDDYTSNIYGDLVKSSSTSYFYAKLNDTSKGEFLHSASSSNDIWEVHDNKGMLYVYGGSSNALVNDASSTSHVYQWYLTDQTDVFGNNIHYTYTKDNEYVYPYQILYTKNIGQGLNGVYEVRFTWQNRDDQLESYQPAFRILNAKKLQFVEVFVNGAKKKEFDFRYVTGVNGVRSLLAGITEVGFEPDSTTKILPETSFLYTLPIASSSSFTLTDSQSLAFGFDRIVDINGDGLNDFVFFRRNDLSSPSNSYKHIDIEWLNQGNLNFQERDATTTININSNPPTLEIPFTTSINNSGVTTQSAVFFMDANNDGYADSISQSGTYSGNPQMSITSYSTSTGTTSQQINSTSTLFYFQNLLSDFGGNTIIGLFPINANGDPNTDFIATNNGNNTLLYTIAGSIGTSTISYSNSPQQSIFSQSNPGGTLGTVKMSSLVYQDINGDGLTDLVQIYSTWYSGLPRTEYKNIWINNGNGLTQITSTSTLANYNLPRTAEDTFNGIFSSSNLYYDYNYDGLIDVSTINGSSATGTGTGFNGTFSYGNNNLPSQSNAFVADLNGDGLSDLAVPRGGSSLQFDVTLSTMKADLLNGIKSNLGASTLIAYAPSVSYTKNDGSQANKIPYPVWTVKNIAVNDGFGKIGTTTYSYEDAYVSSPNRQDTKFAGFGKVLETQPNGMKTISYYDQGNGTTTDEVSDSYSLIGQMYKQEVNDAGGVLNKKDLYEYAIATSSLSGTSTVALLAKTLSIFIDPTSSSTYTTAKAFTYDSNLNKIQDIDYGDVIGTSTLSFTPLNASNTLEIDYSYNNSSTTPKLYLPVSKTVKDGSNNTIGLEKYYYDGNTNTTISNGLLTEKDSYSSSTSKLIEKTVWDTNYGLPTSQINSRGATTTLTYDSYKMFAASSTNTFGQQTNFTYDYNAGKVATITDPNSATTNSTYDSFGRVLKTYRNGNILTENIYSDYYLPYITSKKYFTATDTLSVVSYYNGLGKPIRTESENYGGTYTTMDKVYDLIGNTASETLPYESFTLGTTTASLPSYMYKNYFYDSLSRLIKTATAIGTDTVSYTPRTKVVYDNNSHATKFSYNKDGNITYVNEYIGTSTATTTYTYDFLGNLTKILDSENGVRNIVYDWLGRKISDELTHVASTSSAITRMGYGTSSEYMENYFSDGRLVKTYFDLLGRKATDTIAWQVLVGTSTYATSTNYLNEFFYDTCTNGIGKLCTASSSDRIIKSLTYDIDGNVSKIVTTASTTYWSPSATNLYTYDRQGNNLASGDGSATTTNTYYKSFLQNIGYIDTGTTTQTNVFANPTYNVAGQILTYDRGALQTQNAYDVFNVNRLSNISLLTFGTSSYPFASSTLLSLPANNASSTGTNTKPTISWFLNLMSQGLVPSITVNSTDANNDKITDSELYFRPATTSTTSAYTLLANTTSTSTPILSDNFNRADSSTIGGGWTDNTDSGDHMTIASNKLKMDWASSGTQGYRNIYQTLSQQNNIKITYTWRPHTGNIDSYIPFVGVRGTSANDFLHSYGVALCYGCTAGAVDAHILDNGTYKAMFSNILTPTMDTDYNVEILIDSNNWIEFRIWPASGSRPTSPNAYFDNGSSPYTPSSSGTNLVIEAQHGSNSAYTISVNVDDLTVTPNSGNTTATFVATSSLASSTFIIPQYMFEYNKSFDIAARVKDAIGDWSSYATTTFSTLSSSTASTTQAYCPGKANTILGTVECKNPWFKIEDAVNYFADSYYAAMGGNTAIDRIDILIATSTNFASTTIASSTVIAPIGGYGSFVSVKNWSGQSLLPFTQYYYKVTVTNRYINTAPTSENPVVRSAMFGFTTGDFKTYQNSSYTYDTLNRIKEILKSDDLGYQDILYTYDELSRLTQVAKKYVSTATTTTIAETYTYSPTGRILSNASSSYTYAGNLTQTPTQVGSDVLNWDNRGRLASSTSLGTLIWNDLDRLSQKTIGATTSKYYYDTDGNRILKIDLNASSTVLSKLFTPDARTQNTGSTTSYQISFSNKPIINIDRISSGVSSGDISILSDNFDRTDSSTIGNGWTDNTDSNDHVKISSNKLRFIWASQGQDGHHTIYRSLSQQNNITVSFTWKLGSNTNIDGAFPYLGVRSSSSNDISHSYGPYLQYSPGDNSIGFFVLDNGSFATIQPSVLSHPQKDADFNVEFNVDSNNWIYFRMWPATSTRPTSPTASFTNSGSPYTPNANGSNLLIDAETGSGNPYNATIDVDNLLITTPSTTTSATTTTSIQTLITDHLNSIEKVLDFASGNVISTSTYSSFGQLNKIGTTTSNRGFTNHQMDSDLIYMNARYQNPTYGQFISSDEATGAVGNDNALKEITSQNTQQFLHDPQSLNAYSYVKNNPIQYSDPDGKNPIALLLLWLEPAREYVPPGFEAKQPYEQKTDYTYDALSIASIAFNPKKGVDEAIEVGGPKIVNVVSKADNILSDSALVCRGGLCTVGSFESASGVIKNSKGELFNVSVNSSSNKNVLELTKTIPNGKVGVTTVGDIRKAGGDVVPSPNASNPNHATVNGLNASALQQLFKVTVNPSK